jgi:YHS domain-containing protein
MKRLISVIAVLLVLVFAGATVFAADQASGGKAQATCPILAGQIDKSLYADYEGKRVYFCCAGCKDDFNKDPAGYIKKMEEQGIVLEKTPAAK